VVVEKGKAYKGQQGYRPDFSMSQLKIFENLVGLIQRQIHKYLGNGYA